MSEQLELEIKNRPGKVEWNFEHYKGWLTESLQKYNGLVFAESEIAEAKKTHATLEKFKKELTAEMKRVKDEYVAPYAEFEKQVKELVGMVDAVNIKINDQIKAADEKYRAEKLKTLKEYWDKEVVITFPIPFEKIFIDKWLNKTVSENKAQAEMQSIAEQLNSNFHTIAIIQDEAEKLFLSADYPKTLNLSVSMQNWTNHCEQVKRDEEIRRQFNEHVNAPQPEIKPSESAPITNEQSSIHEENAPQIEPEELWEITFRVRATKEQANGLAMYMKQHDIKFQFGNKKKVEG